MRPQRRRLPRPRVTSRVAAPEQRPLTRLANGSSSGLMIVRERRFLLGVAGSSSFAFLINASALSTFLHSGRNYL